MHCPSCRALDTRVVDSRLAEQGTAIRRRRQCGECSSRFTTFERMEEVVLMVVKSHGGKEPFSREKVRHGLVAACKSRIAVSEVERIVDVVEDKVRTFAADVTSEQIGLLVLEALRNVDEVAYLRFASVYKNFHGASDFQRELQALRKLTAAERIG